MERRRRGAASGGGGVMCGVEGGSPTALFFVFNFALFRGSEKALLFQLCDHYTCCMNMSPFFPLFFRLLIRRLVYGHPKWRAGMAPLWRENQETGQLWAKGETEWREIFLILYLHSLFF